MLFSRLEAIFSMFRTNPANAALYLILYVTAVLFSLALHELGHGLAAFRCGDDTARMAGRLTLNPLKHIDPTGAFCMLFFGFGWARPTPVIARNFRHFRRDSVLVFSAGVAVNLALFLIFTVLSVVLNQFLWIDAIPQALKNEIYPLPLELVTGGDFTDIIEFMRVPALMYPQFFFEIMAMLNISLAVFNLLPVPPLDGWRILDFTVLRGRVRITPQTYQWIQFGLIALMLTGWVGRGLSFVTGAALDGMLWLCRAVGGLL